LTGGLTHADISAKCKSNFGFNVSNHQLTQFYKQHVVKHLTKLRKRAVDTAAGYVEEAAKDPGQFTAAALDALEAKTMSACFDPLTSPKELKVYMELLVRWQEQRLRAEEIKLKLRRLNMLERRQKKLQAVLEMESKLSSDEVAQRCRLIFKKNGFESNPRRIEETPEGLRLPSISP
jgi:hypothetical protein